MSRAESNAESGESGPELPTRSSGTGNLVGGKPVSSEESADGTDRNKDKPDGGLPPNGGFLYKKPAENPGTASVRPDNDRFRVSPNRVLNYGSMERGKHKNPHFERRLSYGYGQHDPTDGRTTPYNFGKTHAGSLERDKNFKFVNRTTGFGQPPVKRGPNPDYGHIPRKDELGQGTFPLKDSTNKHPEGPKDYRCSPSKTDSMNRTSYYSHVSRLERGGEGPAGGPNVRPTSYDFERSPGKSDRQVNYTQGKLGLDFGKDRRRLSQPPAGGPPPFYHPPPPPGPPTTLNNRYLTLSSAVVFVIL